MNGVTYDAGALIAAERGDRQMWALHAGYLALEVRPTVPAPVLAQVWRSGRNQVQVARLLKPSIIAAFDEGAARRTGELLGRAGSTDIVDATVVDGAIDRGDVVVSSDPNDLTELADAMGATLVIVAV